MQAARPNRWSAGPRFSLTPVRVQSPELASQENELEMELELALALPEPPSDDEPLGPMSRTPPHAERLE